MGSSVQNYIVAARTAQGYDEWHNSSHGERLDVINRWQTLQVEIEKEKNLARHGSFHERHCYLKTTIEARKGLSAKKKKGKKSAKGYTTEDTFTDVHASHPFVRAQQVDPNHKSADFEEAIRASVAATSHGNPHEDQVIERAIRASVKELRVASKDKDNGEAIQRAIEASVNEAAQARSEGGSKIRSTSLEETVEHQKELAAVLQRSVQESQQLGKSDQFVDVDFDDSSVDTDDENFRVALERSKMT